MSGIIQHIHRAWEAFHESVEKAKTILKNNQYPSTFETLTKIVQEDIKSEDEDRDKDISLFSTAEKPLMS